MTTAKPDIRVLDADTYANGDPTTFGLPLEQYAYLRHEAPCYLHEFDDPMLIDRAWIVSRNADIWAVDRNSELYAADRGGVNMWKVTPLDPKVGGKPGRPKELPDTLLADALALLDALSIKKAHFAGLSLGGAGFYPESEFVHADVGPVRTWAGR